MCVCLQLLQEQWESSAYRAPQRVVKCGPAGFLQYFTFTATHLEIGSSSLGAKPSPLSIKPPLSEPHPSPGTWVFSVSVLSQLHNNSMKPSTQVRRQNRKMDTDIKRIVCVLGYDGLRQIQKYTVNTQSRCITIYLYIYDIISEHILMDLPTKGKVTIFTTTCWVLGCAVGLNMADGVTLQGSVWLGLGTIYIDQYFDQFALCLLLQGCTFL